MWDSSRFWCVVANENVSRNGSSSWSVISWQKMTDCKPNLSKAEDLRHVRLSVCPKALVCFVQYSWCIKMSGQMPTVIDRDDDDTVDSKSKDEKCL